MIKYNTHLFIDSGILNIIPHTINYKLALGRGIREVAARPRIKEQQGDKFPPLCVAPEIS